MQFKEVREVAFGAAATQVLEIAFNMQESNIGSTSRRVPVVNRGQRLVGVVLLRDLVKTSEAKVNAASRGISRPTH